LRKHIAALVVAAAATCLLAAPAQAAKPQQTTIVDTVVALSGSSGFDENGGDFDILREAVLATGLDATLSKRRQLTVFAPTDQAFLDLTGAATEADAFAGVAALGLDAVAEVLAYHVAPGRRTAEDVVPATRIRTLQRGFITKDAGTAVLMDAVGRESTIVAPDAALVDNGVIHVIDSVLLPFAP
jgi:uncharacterized surface protein with fasciclin (FAS1) repeats